MLKVVQKACEEFIATLPGFWLLAGATDVSFETGSNARYRDTIERMQKSCCPKAIADQLKFGVNGNLSRILERQHPGLWANKGRKGLLRPDIWFGLEDSPIETIVEIRAVYEMTMPKFYSVVGTHSVSDDRKKLIEVRRTERGFKGSLLQVVFFLELPNYSYPAGNSLGRSGWKRWESRDSYRCCGNISDQFKKVRENLPKPTFPSADRPQIHKLRPPSVQLNKMLKQWNAATFRPTERGWVFRPSEHLNDVRVGYAIWAY